VRTTLNIDDSLLKTTKKYAIERNCTLGQIVEEALHIRFSTLSKQADDQASSRALKTFKGNGLCDGIDLNDSASLLERMES
jgi:hypothetical protein